MPDVTVKLLELVARPPGAVTAIGPVVAPAGTVAVILMLELTVKLALVPLNVTTEAEVKLVPLMVTLVPPAAAPEDGERLPMPRGTLASCRTVRPDVVSAKRYTPFSSVVRKQP